MNDDLDRELKREFQATFSGTAKASQRLHQLAPAMGRARRRRQALTAATSSLAALVVVMGVGMATRAVGQEAPVPVVANQGDYSSTTQGSVFNTSPPPASIGGSDSSSGTGDRGSNTTSPDRASEAATPAGVAASTTSDVPTTSQEPAPSTTAFTPSPTTTANSIPTSDPTTTLLAPTTTGAPTTTIDPENKIYSDCGHITVEIDGDAISLADVEPNPGMEVDRKNEGPKTVEVSFEGPTGHCEIEAEIKDGALHAEVSNEPQS